MQVQGAMCAAWLAIALPLPIAWAQPAPAAAKRPEAETRFQHGLQLFKAGDAQTALSEFQRAQELTPHAGILYYIGQCYLQLQDYQNALTALDRYLKESGSTVSASRKAETERDITRLRTNLTHITIDTKDPDVEISIDGIVVGKSPLKAPIATLIGKHKIKVSKDGFKPATTVVTLESGKPMTVSLNPLPKAEPPHHHHHKR